MRFSNECKRRKVKCDGLQPCSLAADVQQCRHPANIPTRTHINGPVAGERRSTTSQAVETPSVESVHLAPDDPLRMPPGDTGVSTESPGFFGPSSSEYTLNVVSENLKTLGLPSAILGKTSSMTENGSQPISPFVNYGSLVKLLTMDPLWDWKLEDATHLINSWFNGVGLLYPVLQQSQMINAANKIFECLNGAQGDRPRPQGALAAEALLNNEANKLKVVLAIGRTLESGGRNDQAQRLFQSITETVEGLMWNSGGIDGVQLLVLVAIYYYHLDDEVRAGRIIRFAAQSCLEMGLHRQERVERRFALPERRTIALTFMSVYMFERRTSLGQGTPFSIQDFHVGPYLSSLESADSILLAMLEWTKLAGKTWHALNSQGEKGVKTERQDLDYLDYQVIQWYNQLNDHLKLDRGSLSDLSYPRETIYHQAVFFIRKCHLRNLIHRPILQNLSKYPNDWKNVIQACDIARESIRTLSELHAYTPLIQTHLLFFKHVLLSCFGNVLLAVVNAPNKLWSHVREEFNLALELIWLLSTQSAPMLRLWQRLEGLRELQTKLSQSATTLELQEESGSFENIRMLRLEELFPPFQPDLFGGEGDNSHGFGMRLPIMREQVNSLFDAIAGPDFLFNFTDDEEPRM
ncbi:hypothetical protein IQ07DRAFT_519307 [Pyrenochaeta sp. DS3sAY3a]|nr:hypothetical protein IQ07DRAFT_519307 [Pyrenochaeta sp. DS3sAY3a]